RTVRGPVGVPLRVEGWREYARVFGGLTEDAMTPWALRGYFDNDAQVAHVIRLLGTSSQCASGVWNAGMFDATRSKRDDDWAGASGLTAIQFRITASSPGCWANKTTVRIRYWLDGSTGRPEIQLEVSPPNETAEILIGIDPESLADQVNQRSAYI